MPVSSRGYFTMARETANTGTITARPRDDKNTFNSVDYPAYWAYPVEEVEFSPEKQFIDFQEIRGSRQAYTTLDGAFQPTAMIKGAVYPGAALGQIMYGAFGDVKIIDGAAPFITYDWDSGTAGNQMYEDDTAGTSSEMAFFDGAKLPRFTLERSDGRDGVATIVERLVGCKVESLQFTANFGEKVDMTVNFQATKKNETLAAATARYGYTSAGVNSSAGTPSGHLAANKIVYPGQETSHTASDISPLYFNRAAIKVGGSAYAYLKTLSWEMTNTLTRQETLNATLNSNSFNITPTTDGYDIYEGGVECTLSGTAVFENLNLYNRLMSGEEFSVELWLGSDTVADKGSEYGAVGSTTLYTTDDAYNGLYFYWPKVKVSRASIPFTAGEVIESDVEFKVIFSPSVAIDKFDGTSSGITGGGSMFAKMISRVGAGTASDRPWFFY